VRVLRVTGVVLADILILALLLSMLAIGCAFAATALSFASAGVQCAFGEQSLTLGSTHISQIPHMPHQCAIILGIAVCAPFFFFAVLTEYGRLYFTQALRVAIRWNKNFFRKDGLREPPLPLNPWIGRKKRAFMRTLARVSLLLFIYALCTWFICTLIMSRSLTPWNVWGWLEQFGA